MRFAQTCRAIAALGLSLTNPANAQTDTGWTELPKQNPFVTGYEHKATGAFVIIGEIPGSNGQALEDQMRAMAKDYSQPQACPGLAESPIRQGAIPSSLEMTSAGPTPGTVCTFTTLRKTSTTYAAVSLDASATQKPALNFARSKLRSAGGGATASPITKTPAPAPVQKVAARPTPTPASQPIRGTQPQYPRGIVGMWRRDWVENQYRYPDGLTLVAMNQTVILTPGGYFMIEVPSGLTIDDAGAQAYTRNNPDGGGRYVVNGGTISLNYASGDRETIDLSKGGRTGSVLRYRSGVLSPKYLFPDGFRLSGTYSSERITNAGGGIFVVGDDDFSFAPDGRFAHGGSVSFTGPAVSSIGGRKGRTGRYEVKGSALHLRYDDGEVKVMSMFQETIGKEIWFDDEMFSPVK